jgi:hypothetical protein
MPHRDASEALEAGPVQIRMWFVNPTKPYLAAFWYLPAGHRDPVISWEEKSKRHWSRKFDWGIGTIGLSLLLIAYKLLAPKLSKGEFRFFGPADPDAIAKPASIAKSLGHNLAKGGKWLDNMLGMVGRDRSRLSSLVCCPDAALRANDRPVVLGIHEDSLPEKNLSIGWQGQDGVDPREPPASCSEEMLQFLYTLLEEQWAGEHEGYIPVGISLHLPAVGQVITPFTASPSPLTPMFISTGVAQHPGLIALEEIFAGGEGLKGLLAASYRICQIPDWDLVMRAASPDKLQYAANRLLSSAMESDFRGDSRASCCCYMAAARLQAAVGSHEAALENGLHAVGHTRPIGSVLLTREALGVVYNLLAAKVKVHPRWIATYLSQLGAIVDEHGCPPDALELCNLAETIFTRCLQRDLGHPYYEALHTQHLMNEVRRAHAIAPENPTKALEILNKVVLTVGLAPHSQRAVGVAHFSIGRVYAQHGDLVGGLDYLEAHGTHIRRCGGWGNHDFEAGIGWLLHVQGREADALPFLQAAHVRAVKSGIRPVIEVLLPPEFSRPHLVRLAGTPVIPGQLEVRERDPRILKETFFRRHVEQARLLHANAMKQLQ